MAFSSGVDSKEVFGVAPFDGTNFTIWCRRVQAVFTAKELDTFLEEEASADKVADVLKSKKAYALLLSLLDDNTLASLQTEDTACKIWKKLQATYRDKGAVSQILTRKRLATIRKYKDVPMRQHIESIMKLVSDLRISGSEIKVKFKHRKKSRILLAVIFAFGTLCEGAEKKKCDKPWRTFRNVCFMFSDLNNQRFNEAQSFCYKQGGFLASVRNSAEHGFIIKTIQGMGSSYQRVRWFIGLYQHDPKDNKNYRWLDGSVSGFRNWMPTQPNSVYERCAMLDGSNGFKWRDDVCTNRALFICRKDLDEQGSMKCYKGTPPPHQILDKKGISVTECLEHCRGLGYPLAGLIPNKCYCIQGDNLDKMTIASRLSCNGNCDNQHCGNKDFITIYNLTHYKDTAESCEDLGLLGFSSPSTYVTKVGDEERLTNCFTDGEIYVLDYIFIQHFKTLQYLLSENLLKGFENYLLSK